jgi:hypothetical protein
MFGMRTLAARRQLRERQHHRIARESLAFEPSRTRETANVLLVECCPKHLAVVELPMSVFLHRH